MAEPAELLLIKDQYASALQCLNQGLAAEESDRKSEALVYYRKGHEHLTQGLEIPTGGQRHQGEAWDRARRIQTKMMEMLRITDAHLSDLEKSPKDTKDLLLIDLTPNLYPDLPTNAQPSSRSLKNLYPNIPPTPNSAPIISPASCAVPNTHTFPAAALNPVTMDNPGELPPAYTPQPTDGHRSLAFDPAGVRFWSRKPGGVAGDGKELLFIPSGVQLFFVEPNGQVSSLSHPGYLRVIAVDSQRTAGNPSAFLHVCDRQYPLTADTPVLLANSGIFMLPDCLSETPGSYVGLVLSSELPAADRDMFQDLLLQLVDFKTQDPEGTGVEIMNLTTKVPIGSLKEQEGLRAEEEKKLLPGWSEKISQGILSGTTRLSESLAKGAEATGKAIHKGAAKIRDRITPEETPSDVSPNVTKGLNAAKQATGGAVRVSQFLVNGMSMIAGHVADKVAPHVKKHGAKLVPQSLKKTQDGRASNLDGAKFVAASSVQGLCTVWSSLEAGAKLVCKSVGAETVTTVKYKYGDDAGQATDTALKSVGNLGVAAHNFDNLGIKAFLKTAGKKTAKTMVGSPDKELAETEEKKVRKEEQQAEREDVSKKEDEKKK